MWTGPFSYIDIKSMLRYTNTFFTDIVNASFNHGIFLSAFKEGFVWPLLKKPRLDKEGSVEKTIDPYQTWLSSPKCWRKFRLVELMVTLMKILCVIHFSRHIAPDTLQKRPLWRSAMILLQHWTNNLQQFWSSWIYRFWCHWPQHTVPMSDCIIWFSWQCF